MMKKRGRKRVNDLYFGPEEELAVIKFLESDDNIERNAIYNQWLRKPENFKPRRLLGGPNQLQLKCVSVSK